MDITYNILKNYETEILPLIEENLSIETFVQTVLDLANIQYTFTLMKNMNQEKADMIRQQSYQGLSEEEINIIKVKVYCTLARSSTVCIKVSIDGFPSINGSISVS